MDDYIPLFPGAGWFFVAVAVLLATWVLSGRVAKDLKPHLTRSPPTRELRLWYGLLAVGSAISGIGMLIHEFEVFLPGLGLVSIGVIGSSRFYRRYRRDIGAEE